MIKKTIQLARRHYKVIILALFVGLISSVPQYLAPKLLHNFQGIYHGVMDDIIYYQVRVKDVLDGHSFLTNPYLYEHKDGFSMQFWLPDYIIAKPIGWLGVSVPVGFILWTFVLTFILTIISYSILYILTGSKKWSLLVSTLLHLGLFGLTFLRLPSPAFNFIFWLSTLFFSLLWIKRGGNKCAVLTAVSFGLLFHIYPYFWTFYVTLFGVYLILGFFLRIPDFQYKKIIFVLFGAGIIGIPYFVSLVQSSHLSTYTESLARLGLIHTHFPSGIDSVILASIVILVFLYMFLKKQIELNKLNTFLFSGVLTSIIVINQHVITGNNLEFSSHYYLGNMFWLAFSGSYLVYIFIQKRSVFIKKIIFISCIVFILLISLLGIKNVLNQQATYNESEIYSQNYAPIFHWLNRNAKPDDVVYTNDDIGYFLPVYTSQNVYYSAFSILFFMTDKEVEDRFIINHYFDTFTREYIIKNQRMIFGGYYINQFGHMRSKNFV
ncbi:MAG: hypothetical protein ACYCZW_00445, partial [Minisyncoccota bacterium]